MRWLAATLICALSAGLAMAEPGAGPTGSDVAFHASLNTSSAKMYTINKFGEAADLDTHVTDVWEGVSVGAADVWVPPNAARIHSIASTSDVDSDTGGAIAQGAGMRTVRVFGLTSWTDAAETIETVIMDGTDGTDTANAYVIIHRMYGVTWGAGGVNAGIIKATAASDSTITAGIAVGNNQTRMAIYGLSSTMRLLVSRFYVSVSRFGTAGTATGNVLYMSDPATNAAANTAWGHKQDMDAAVGGPWDRGFLERKTFNGPGIIKLQMTGSANNMMALGEFDGIIVRD